ncbi:hypothetical protein HJG60_010089 [Phyllostomus discolor]|nr:hypothetical protein HJG60_010089 [Phyllostomus discolor]
MMFNQDGGIVMSKTGNTKREWMWPSKGKLDDPVEIWVNKFISVKISGRFSVSLVYKWHPHSLRLSLAPVKCRSLPSGSLETSLPDVNPISEESRELFKAYKMRCKLMKSTTQVKDPSSLTGPVDTSMFDPAMDISPMSDIATAIKLRRLQRKAKHILFNWLDHYRFSLGLESLHMSRVPKLPQQVVRKQKVSPAELPLKQSAKEKDENREYLLNRNTFVRLKGVFKPPPLPRIQRAPASHQHFRLSLPTEGRDAWFASHLVCPVVLRRILCGKEGDSCRCSTYSIPEVTDLEYDYLISEQLSSIDQIVIVCVFSALEKDNTIQEVAEVYREQNRTRSMPCIQSCSDSFRFLKYNIISASKFTGSRCPLLVQRHNVIPGIFLMYIQGKLLFANFIFNGYSTSAKDLQKQIVKTRSDYHMGYFLPSDFRIRTQSTSCFRNEDILL